MTSLRKKSENIRRFILDHITQHPSDIAKLSAEHFQITRQAVNKHLQKLSQEQLLIVKGNTRNKTYELALVLEWKKIYNIQVGLAEDIIWRNDIRPVLGNMPDNIIDIWHFGFTEMCNNVIDHSNATNVYVYINKTAINTEMLIFDNGVGIFKKIQIALGLIDERHSILELSKGKLTTDPKRHSGEGIFFTSRMFDSYDILSGGIHFFHQFEQSEDWIAEINPFPNGTAIWMKIKNHTSRTMKKIFDQYTSIEDFRFNKTVVPVKLAQYEDELLVSRSQAKRLLARIELFQTVIFDFTEVKAIGQAFADEVFRVFANHNPKIDLRVTHANESVMQMISRAKAH